MNFSRLGVVASLFVLAWASGCGRVDIENPQGEIDEVTLKQRLDGTLTIHEQSGHVFSGLFQNGNSTVEFESSWTEGHVDSKMALSSGSRVTIAYEAIGRDDGILSWEVENGRFHEGDRELLSGFHAALADILPYGTLPGTETADRGLPQEVIIRNYAGFFSEAPVAMPRGGQSSTRISDLDIVNEPPPPNGYAAPRPATCTINPSDQDGVALLWSCCWANPLMAWEYDRPDTCLIHNRNRCGAKGDLNTHCAGRCGPGCLSAPFYFQDCLDHDFCVDVTRGGSGPGDPNCGDEFMEAADDFAAITIGVVAPLVSGSIFSLFLYAVCF